MQQYADIYLLQSFAVNKYLHTVVSVGFLFTVITSLTNINWLVFVKEQRVSEMNLDVPC